MESLGVEKSGILEVVAQTGIIGAMMFLLFRQLLSRAEKFDVSASTREDRMSETVAGLQGYISSELVQIIKSNAELLSKNIYHLEHTSKLLEEAYRENKAMRAKLTELFEKHDK